MKKNKISKIVDSIVDGHESVVNDIIKDSKKSKTIKNLVASLIIGKNDNDDVEFKVWKKGHELQLIKDSLSEKNGKDINKQMSKEDILKEVLATTAKIICDKSEIKKVISNLKAQL